MPFAGDWNVSQANPIDFVISNPGGIEMPGLGVGFTVQISKNGGPFVLGAGVKSEVGLGWYRYVSTVAEADTLGEVIVVVSAPGAQQQNLLYQVVSVFVATPPTYPIIIPNSCSSRFAEAWQFASFFCISSLLSGVDTSGAIPPVPSATLIDPTQNFLIHGARANTGQILYNLSRGQVGKITSATETTLVATGVDWYDGETYQVVFINAAEIAQIEHWLNTTAGDIRAALGAAGATSCTYSCWGANFLAEINIILARIFFDCPCAPTLTDGEKSKYADMVAERLKQIRSGEVDVCEGETGSLFPAIGWAEQAHTEWNAARIIVNDTNRRIIP